MTLRLRKILLPAADYHALPTAFDRMGEALALRAGISDLIVHAVRPDGDRVQVFVHSESFPPESCLCRAHEIVLPGA